MLCDPRDFTDVIKVIKSRVLDLSGWSNLITWTLKSRELFLAGVREMLQKKSERCGVWEVLDPPVLEGAVWEAWEEMAKVSKSKDCSHHLPQVAAGKVKGPQFCSFSQQPALVGKHILCKSIWEGMLSWWYCDFSLTRLLRTLLSLLGLVTHRNCALVNVCGFKPLGLWWFVMQTVSEPVHSLSRGLEQAVPRVVATGPWDPF